MGNSQPLKPPSLWRHHKCQAAKSFVWTRNHQMPKVGRGKQARNFSLVFWKRKRHVKAPGWESHPWTVFWVHCIPSASSDNWSCSLVLPSRDLTGGAYEYFLDDRHINEWILTRVLTCFLLSCTSLEQSYKQSQEGYWGHLVWALSSLSKFFLQEAWQGPDSLGFLNISGEEGSSPLEPAQCLKKKILNRLPGTWYKIQKYLSL